MRTYVQGQVLDVNNVGRTSGLRCEQNIAFKTWLSRLSYMKFLGLRRRATNNGLTEPGISYPALTVFER